MEGDRKYSQRGYQQDNNRGERRSGEHYKSPGPRPPIDITGPRLPRLVQSVTAARCFSCSTMLPPNADFTGTCPKCEAALHCCKQCTHFEPSTRFQCVKPILVRIPLKDQKNDCTLFTPRLTVARDTAGPVSGSRSTIEGILAAPPRNASDAKNAFEKLFKK